LYGRGLIVVKPLSLDNAKLLFHKAFLASTVVGSLVVSAEDDTKPRGCLELTSAMRKLTLLSVTAILFASAVAVAQDDTAVLNFVVVRDYNGKPIRNASVVMHPVEKNGKQSKGGLQLKTDPEGKARFDGAPYGKLRVQVLASGFQTFGSDYDIDKPTVDIEVKMKRPAGQYSIYEEHPGEKKDEPEQAKPPEKDAKEKPQ
jgi:Carboxypeptidase regulatory-like domain